jgi:hypothetical protein
VDIYLSTCFLAEEFPNVPFRSNSNGLACVRARDELRLCVANILFPELGPRDDIFLEKALTMGLQKVSKRLVVTALNVHEFKNHEEPCSRFEL